MNLQVLFKNLNVDMKELKPSKLLEGLERELEGNPDFSNKDPVFSQSPSPAPSANDSAQTVSVPSLPQQLDIPTEVSIVTQSATSLSSPVNAQVCLLQMSSLQRMKLVTTYSYYGLLLTRSKSSLQFHFLRCFY